MLNSEFQFIYFCFITLPIDFFVGCRNSSIEISSITLMVWTSPVFVYFRCFFVVYSEKSTTASYGCFGSRKNLQIRSHSADTAESVPKCQCSAQHREIGKLECGWKIVPKIGVWLKQVKRLFYTNRRDSIGILGSWDCQYEEPILNFGSHQLGIRINRYMNALFEFPVLPFGNKIGVIVRNHFSFSLAFNEHIVVTDIHTASLFGHSGNICNNDIIIGSLYGEVSQTPTSIISKSTENWLSPERCLAMKIIDQHYWAILALATACRE